MWDGHFLLCAQKNKINLREKSDEADRQKEA